MIQAQRFNRKGGGFPGPWRAPFSGRRRRTGVDPIVERNAVNLFGPGHSAGATGATAASTGAAVNYTISLVNRSGAPITEAALVFAGWYLTSSGTSAVGNDVATTANIEYPVGGTTTTVTQAGNSTITVANNTETKTDFVTLPTPIPNGATFEVNLSCTITAGLNYLASVTDAHGGLGLCGVLTRASSSSLKKAMPFCVGDSIMTYNNSALATAAAYLGCPSAQMTIPGTGASAYGGSSAANFTRQVALAKMLGSTVMFSNFGSNDLSAGRTSAQLTTDLQNMRTKANAEGIPFVQGTLLPKTNRTTVTASSVTSSGTTMSVTVPNGALFVVDRTYRISGATQTEYNGVWFCTAVVGNVVSLFFPGSGTPTATGTITITSGRGNATNAFSSAELQTPTTAFAAGSGSPRGTFNAGVRAGAFDGFLELGDIFERTRDSGIWLVGGDTATLPGVQTCTVSSGVNNTTFNSNYSLGDGTIAGGTVQFITGANAALRRPGSSSSGVSGNIVVIGSLTATPSSGDTFYAAACHLECTDDGTHPRAATGSVGAANYFGGQAILVNAMIAWLNGLLA